MGRTNDDQNVMPTTGQKNRQTDIQTDRQTDT